VDIIPQRTAIVAIDEIRPSPENVNLGDVGAISQSMEANGFFGSVLVQESSAEIICGEHRWRAAKALGAQDIPVTYLDVDDDRARRIRLADNRTARLGADDPARLASLLQELAATPAGLAGTGWDGDALDELLAELGHEPTLQGDPDAVPEVPEDQEPVTRRGDIITLGRHRLGCIDSTSLDEVRRLLGGVTPDMVWTDPPYGINIVRTGYVGGGAAYDIPFGGVKDESAEQRQARLARVRGTDGAPKPFGSKPKGQVGPSQPGPKKIIACGLYEPVLGDDSTQTAVDAYRLCADLGVPVLIFWGANHYASALPDSSAWIVWDKENAGTTFADAELAWTNQDTAVRIFRHMWNGLLKDSERNEKRIAPTQKPVALAAWCYQQYGKEGDVVLDLFGGSGTALIACERTGRTCYMAELSDRYCDLIVQRWQTLTGQTAVRESAAARGAALLPTLA
jgi:16S rRNA G966 N2-methylase RsmD